MYTSGWPKIQNRCCHRMGMPPLDTSKKFVPNWRSNITSTSAMVIAGKERMMRKDVISVIHVNTGRRIIVMPGARRLMMVTMKFSAAAMEATPSSCRPRIQKSVAWVGL